MDKYDKFILRSVIYIVTGFLISVSAIGFYNKGWPVTFTNEVTATKTVIKDLCQGKDIDQVCNSRLAKYEETLDCSQYDCWDYDTRNVPVGCKDALITLKNNCE